MTFATIANADTFCRTASSACDFVIEKENDTAKNSIEIARMMKATRLARTLLYAATTGSDSSFL
ncbi:hypothetical protein D3C73_1574840 [compost metagenome]